LDYYFWNFV